MYELEIFSELIPGSLNFSSISDGLESMLSELEGYSTLFDLGAEFTLKGPSGVVATAKVTPDLIDQDELFERIRKTVLAIGGANDPDEVHNLAEELEHLAWVLKKCT